MGAIASVQPPAGVTHFVVQRQSVDLDPKTKKQRARFQAVPLDDGAGTKQVPFHAIGELSPEDIRQIYGPGVYRLAWFAIGNDGRKRPKAFGPVLELRGTKKKKKSGEARITEYERMQERAHREAQARFDRLIGEERALMAQRIQQTESFAAQQLQVQATGFERMIQLVTAQSAAQPAAPSADVTEMRLELERIRTEQRVREELAEEEEPEPPRPIVVASDQPAWLTAILGTIPPQVLQAAAMKLVERLLGAPVPVSAT